MKKNLQHDRSADWVGPNCRKFNWRKLRFIWGRWNYNTNCCGKTTQKWFIESEKE